MVREAGAAETERMRFSVGEEFPNRSLLAVLSGAHRLRQPETDTNTLDSTFWQKSSSWLGRVLLCGSGGDAWGWLHVCIQLESLICDRGGMGTVHCGYIQKCMKSFRSPGWWLIPEADSWDCAVDWFLLMRRLKGVEGTPDSVLCLAIQSCSRCTILIHMWYSSSVFTIFPHTVLFCLKILVSELILRPINGKQLVFWKILWWRWRQED